MRSGFRVVFVLNPDFSRYAGSTLPWPRRRSFYIYYYKSYFQSAGTNSHDQLARNRAGRFGRIAIPILPAMEMAGSLDPGYCRCTAVGKSGYQCESASQLAELACWIASRWLLLAIAAATAGSCYHEFRRLLLRTDTNYNGWRRTSKYPLERLLVGLRYRRSL